MFNIYANSTCNNIAAVGGNPHTSLFSTRSFNKLKIGKFRAIYTTKKLGCGRTILADAISEKRE